ncbi:hypothetical protein QOT17_007407 [Balamuthia mandrillaris]
MQAPRAPRNRSPEEEDSAPSADHQPKEPMDEEPTSSLASNTATHGDGEVDDSVTHEEASIREADGQLIELVVETKYYTPGPSDDPSDDGGLRKVWYKCSFNKRTGQKHGEYQEWWPNGQRWSKRHYKEGLLHGKEKWWHHNGHLGYEINWVEGKRHGESKEYFEDGKPLSLVTYKEGKYHGDVKRWMKSGQIDFHEQYVDGKLEGPRQEWHLGGKLFSLTHHHNGKKEGEGIWWFANGNMSTKRQYHNGKKHGEKTSWYKKGGDQQCIKCIENYKDGKLHGECKYWDEYGLLTNHKIYEDGFVRQDLLRR